MAYYLYDAYGGYYKLDDDWYLHLPFIKYSHLNHDQYYNEQNYLPENYQQHYEPDTSLDNTYYDEDYNYGEHGQSVSDEAMITVHQILQDHEVVLFGLMNCSSCGKAMSQLYGKHVPYLVYNIDSDPYIEDNYYFDALETLSGIRNVPQLFIRGKYYGDGAKIRTGLERGEVQRLCRCALYNTSLGGSHRHRWHWSNAPLSPGNLNQVSAENKASSTVNKHLQNNALVLFTLSNCDSCTKTESMLIQKRVPFKVFYVDADPKMGRKQYFDALEALSSNRNLPQLYIRGNYYGDSRRIRNGLENGEIQRLCHCGQVGPETSQQRRSGLPVGNKAQTIIQHLLQNNKVTLFVFTNCAPCEKTKALLEKHNIPYKEHYIDQDLQISHDQYFDALEPLSGIRTVPQLFILGKFYGDSERAQEGIDSGEVQRQIR